MSFLGREKNINTYRGELFMALTILEDCINCDACRPECPTESVRVGEDTYQIDPETCVECVGHFDEPKCVEMCPIDCIVPIAA
ncbi:MAG TPA: YfhL family 4Fe-4S dicluster ferredoxin [Pyrinomonadaceae bacterium]|nr:YfhL family 4Fe-4S dicluster ferredoxin [Pyrinomonadaceae bacterium]